MDLGRNVCTHVAHQTRSTACLSIALKCSAPSPFLEQVADFGEAIAQVNNSAYGLQAGVFTSSIANMKRAHDELEVGGVIIGNVPGFRIDSMPYGGVKDSGLGREGVKYAMEEMSRRLLVY